MNILPIAILVVIIAAIFYLSRRVAWAFSLNFWWTFIVTTLVMAFFMVSMMVIMRMNLTSTLSHVINNISTIGLGVFAFAVFVVIGMDLVQLFVKMPPKVFGLIASGLTVAISGYALYNASNIRTYYQDIDLPNLEQPVRLAQLSDIHIGHFWGKGTVDRLVSIVEREGVDGVVITGDMFDGRVELNEEVIEPFSRLSVPIYFIEGNHDGYSGARDIKSLLTRSGIKVLSNEVAELKGLQIVGLNYLMADNETVNTFHAPPADITIKEILPKLNVDRSRASVMLHHNPIGVNYAADNGINLYLAGHTHAGQMFPATLVAKLMFPFNKGLYRYSDTTQIYVSQGSGTFGPPMRLGTHSEVTILNLR